MVRGQYKVRIHYAAGDGKSCKDISALPYCSDYGVITDDPAEIYKIAAEHGIPWDVAEEAMAAAAQVQRIRGTKIIFKDEMEGIEVWASEAPCGDCRKGAWDG